MNSDAQPSSCSVEPEKITAPPRTLNDFCRICLLRKPSLIPLTSELNGTMIPEMLWKVSGTMLNALEQLPRVICEHCLTKLDLAYSIAQEFRKQEEVLRSFCWKGALIDQLDGFQQTEDAIKVPYSDEVLRKLTSASQTVVAVEEDKPKGESEQPVIQKESTDKGESEFSGEQLDDIIEEVGEVIEEDVQSTEDFEMIVEESSENEESPAKDEKVGLVDCSQDEESQDSVKSIKKEIQEDDKEADSATLDAPSLIITKVEEDEEWIEEEEKLSEQIDEPSESEELAIVSCGETDESQDPIWFDEEEPLDKDGDDLNSNDREPIQEEPPTRKRRKKGVSLIKKDLKEAPKRIIKSEVNADGLYHCKVCDRTFSVQKTFLNHLRSHEHVMQGSFKCPQCDKAFGTKNRLKRHVVIHTRDLSCRECNKTFANVHELRGHQQVHLKGKWKCSSCDFVCYARDLMKEHRQTSKCAKLAGVKPPPKPARLKDPKCPYEGCDYRATKYGAMYVHKRSKHQSTFECDMCDKKFAFANQLKQHETIHTGEKPYQCDVCDKPFRRLYSFKEHMAIHEGEQRYVCNLCGKSFARPRYLAAHVATHSTKRPFECTMCGANYKTKGELTKHVRAKHETLEYGNGNDIIEEDYDYFEDEIYL
ncbi:zinc finger protein 184-like [Aedes albopictus]|uniref:C2h2-type zn-finger protein n=1 Tax=Aedes albopictus TaxID=7160 RepID=A0ABM1ZZJ6_AEDAL